MFSWFTKLNVGAIFCPALTLHQILLPSARPQAASSRVKLAIQIPTIRGLSPVNALRSAFMVYGILSVFLIQRLYLSVPTQTLERVVSLGSISSIGGGAVRSVHSSRSGPSLSMRLENVVEGASDCWRVLNSGVVSLQGVPCVEAVGWEGVDA